MYNMYRDQAQKAIGCTMNTLKSPNSRASNSSSTSGLQLVEYLVSLPSEEIDSLYNQYCTAEEELKFDNFIDSVMEAIIDNSSIEEVQILYNFKNSYIDCGGHNMEFLLVAIHNVSPLISDCMISCAANIDEFLDNTPQSRTTNLGCLEELTHKMAASYATSGIAEVGLALIGIPDVDIVGSLLSAGYDFYSAIEMAHDYDRCSAMH